MQFSDILSNYFQYDLHKFINFQSQFTFINYLLDILCSFFQNFNIKLLIHSNKPFNKSNEILLINCNRYTKNCLLFVNWIEITSHI